MLSTLESHIADVDSDKAATKIQAAFRGYKDRQKVRKTKKAVVTIQATVRGFLARRRLAKSMRRYVKLLEPKSFPKM